MIPNHRVYHFAPFIFILSSTILMPASCAKGELTDKVCSVCASKECMSQSNMLLRRMNPNKDPCQDFYSFACGGFLERFGKDDTRSTYDDTWNTFLIRINDLLEHLKPKTGSVSEKLKIIFDTCMDKETSEINAVPDALDFLNKVGIFDWPRLDSDFQFADLSETLGLLAVYGEFAFITFQPSPYEKTNDLSRLPSPLILPDKFLLDSKLSSKEVKNIIFKVLTYFGVDSTDSRALWESFKSIEDTGMKFQNEEAPQNMICPTGSPVYTKVNCSGEIQENMMFLCKFWKSAARNGDLHRYYSNDTLHISCRWNHHNYIGYVLSNVSSINHRSLANYLALRFLTSHLDDLNLYFQLARKRFSKPKEQEKKSIDSVNRMEYCVAWIIKSMHFALGFEYTRRFMTSAIENSVLNMIQEYIRELSKVIGTQKWMNEKAKNSLKILVEKLDIGFKTSMNNFKNKTKITNIYKQFHPVKGSFLKNILEFTKQIHIAKRDVGFNSFYSSSDYYNMDFGLSLFLPPTYSYGLLKKLNYATLGWIIGHELGHNFKFFFDVIELDKKMENNINNRINCYVNQFTQFILEKVGKKHINKETEEEILADNIGWTLTEKILEKFGDSANEINLPGFEFTPLQIMFVSFAQDSCAAWSKEIEHEFYTSKPQNNQKLRIINVLQNSKLFAETFNCSTGQTMNPPDKCSFFD